MLLFPLLSATFPIMRLIPNSQMLIAMSALLPSLALTAFPQDNPLGEFAGHTDVGSPKLSGSAAYDAARQEYTLDRKSVV